MLQGPGARSEQKAGVLSEKLTNRRRSRCASGEKPATETRTPSNFWTFTMSNSKMPERFQISETAPIVTLDAFS